MLHATPSRNIIVKVETLPRIGEKVVNQKLESVGTVFDVFGPVSSPYVAVKTEVEDAKSLIGQLLYVIPSTRKDKSRKEKRK
jgi:RNA-binding protein